MAKCDKCGQQYLSRVCGTKCVSACGGTFRAVSDDYESQPLADAALHDDAGDAARAPIPAHVCWYCGGAATHTIGTHGSLYWTCDECTPHMSPIATAIAKPTPLPVHCCADGQRTIDELRQQLASERAQRRRELDAERQRNMQLGDKCGALLVRVGEVERERDDALLRAARMEKGVRR